MNENKRLNDELVELGREHAETLEKHENLLERLDNNLIIIIIKQDIRIYDTYSLPNSCGLIGLTFFVDTHKWLDGVIG